MDTEAQDSNVKSEKCSHIEVCILPSNGKDTLHLLMTLQGLQPLFQLSNCMNAPCELDSMRSPEATVRIQGATLHAVRGNLEFPAEAETRIPFWNAWNAPTEIAFSKLLGWGGSGPRERERERMSTPS